MNNQIKGMLYYYTQDQKYNSKVFWTILVATTVAMSILAYFLMDVGDAQFYFAIPFATYTNVCIIAFQTVKKNIPFNLKMGAIRKNIFLSYLYFFVGYSAIVSIIGNTLQWVIEGSHHLFGISNYTFVHLAMFLTDTWFTRTVIDTFVMFFLMGLFFLIGLLFYRLGLLGGGIILGAFLVISLYGLFEGWLIDAFATILSDPSMFTFAMVFLTGIGLYVISYPFIQKITVLKKV